MRRRSLLAVALALLAGAVLAPGAARAASIEKLLMPGKVVQAHAKTEEECAACHDRADPGRQSALCLACHEPIAADVRARTGWHGRMPAPQGQCRACHTEHEGRDADIVRLDRASFDHRLTDFALAGPHAAAACSDCHASGKPFRTAPHECSACHRRDDAHAGRLGADCGQCHEAVRWRPARFDHAKTRFPLAGAHREVSCDGCHAGARYRGTPAGCAACHATDDVHRGSRGEKCADCHVQDRWDEAKFDHARQAGFALLGRHAGVACTGCHRSGRMEDPLPKDCAGCHRADDAHALRFGERCDQCHSTSEWKPVTWDHATRAKFALAGAHARLDCHACHTASVAKQKLGNECVSCHRADDPHRAALGAACDQCHGVEKWNRDVAFDHDLTDFPLLGLHAVMTCAQCHGDRQYRAAAKDCASCHAGRDVHGGGLGRDCAACHSPNGWNLWEFDHARRTKFALGGAHAKLECAGCHRRPPEQEKLPTDCIGCHRDTDVHLGRFGAQCQRCHSTVTFKGAVAR